MPGFRCIPDSTGCYVRLPGAGNAIRVRANTAALSVCIAAGPVGYRAAALTRGPM